MRQSPSHLIMFLLWFTRLALVWMAASVPFNASAQSTARGADLQASAIAQLTTPQSISDINAFLEQCPTTDPLYAQFRADLKLRRNGALVGDIPCTAPISSLPLAQYTDELIYMQTVRTIYYLDLGRSGHLPWTSGTLYQWMTSKIKGIHLSDSAPTSYCCDTFDGETYIVIKTQTDSNRDFDRRWKGISGNLSLMMHEVRHTDGFPHNSGCGIPNGCDDTYDEGNLSPYGIQWWLEKSWLTSYLPIGLSCSNITDLMDVLNYHRLNANNQFRNRFTSNPPPVLDMPPVPCPTNLTLSGFPGYPEATAGSNLIFSTQLQNLGADTTGVVLTVTFPSQTTNSFAYASQGTWSGTGAGPLVFDLGAVAFNNFPIDISFDFTIDGSVTGPTALIGQYTLTWAGGGNVSGSYGAIANALNLFLPLIQR